MATFIVLANWTDQGLRTVEESPRRLDAAKKTLEDMGGQFRSFYMTVGVYDLMLIFDAPDDAVAARFLMMWGKGGNVRTSTLRAFPESAYREIMNSVGGK